MGRKPLRRKSNTAVPRLHDGNRLAEDRPTAAQRGYGSRWQKARAGFIAKHPFCCDCEAEGVLTPTEDIDHDPPVTGADDPGFWDRSRWFPRCHSCHSRKTRTQDMERGRRAAERS